MTKYIVQIGRKYYGLFDTEAEAQQYSTAFEADPIIHPLTIVGAA